MLLLPQLLLPILIAAATVTLAAAIFTRFVPTAYDPAAGPVRSLPVALGSFFGLALLVSLVAGYLAGRHLPAGAEYFEVFRIAGTAAMLGYTTAHLSGAIWGRRSWRGVPADVAQGIAFGLLTGGAFGGFWP